MSQNLIFVLEHAVAFCIAWFLVHIEDNIDSKKHKRN